MKYFSSIVLRVVIIIAGLAMLALCYGGAWMVTRVWESHPARHLLTLTMLSGLYLAAIPFFIGLYQAMKLLAHKMI